MIHLFKSNQNELVFILIILWGIFYFAFKSGRMEFDGIEHRVSMRLLSGMVVLIFAAGIFLSIAYLHYPGYADHVEPQIASVSWMSQQQSAIYHGIDSRDRYALLYGPLSYIVTGYFLKFFTPSILTSKLSGILCFLLSQLIFFMAIKRNRSLSLLTSTTLCALFLLQLLTHKYYTLSNRPDSLILFLTTIGILMASSKNRKLGIFCVVLISAIAAQAKIHAPIYLLPWSVCLFYEERKHPIFLTGAVLVGILIFSLPFFIIPDTFSTYLHWLQEAAKHGLDGKLFFKNCKLTAAALLPLFVLIVHGRQKLLFEDRLILCLLIASMLIVCLIAAKAGAGKHHLLPFYAPIIWLAAQKIQKIQVDYQRALRPLFCITAIPILAIYFMIALANQQNLLTLIYNIGEQKARHIEFKHLISATNGNEISMGYTDNDHYRETFLRPLITFQSGYDHLDAAALMDMERAGITLPRASYDLIGPSGIPFWILPKNGKPFSMNNFYSPGLPLFPQSFRNLFDASYRISITGKYYNVWQLKQFYINRGNAQKTTE